jgi:HEAT repeat protein
LRVIRSGTATERQSAAHDLWGSENKIDEESAMDALIPALADEDAGVRARAAESLGWVVYRLRERPPDARATGDSIKRRIDLATRGLVSVLSDREASVRAAVATGLGTTARRRSPGRLTPEQLTTLNDPSNAVRRQAAMIIYGSPDVTLRPELSAALRDESAEVRASAAWALVQFGPALDREVPEIIAMLERAEPTARKAYDDALQAAWPTPAVVPDLIGFLKNRDPVVRFHAAQLLGRIGPESRPAIPALVAMLQEPVGSSYQDPARAAARALGQMGPIREAIEALTARISRERIDENVAAWSRARHGGEPRAVALHDAAHESSRIMSAMDALGDIGPPAAQAVPALVFAFEKALEANLTMAQTAIPAALGRIAPNSAVAPDAVAVLIRGLDSTDVQVRQGAVEALGHFGTDSSAAVPRLRAIRDDYDGPSPAVGARSAPASRLPTASVVDHRTAIRDAAVRSLAAIEAGTSPDAPVERARSGR